MVCTFLKGCKEGVGRAAKGEGDGRAGKRVGKGEEEDEKREQQQQQEQSLDTEKSLPIPALENKKSKESPGFCSQSTPEPNC